MDAVTSEEGVAAVVVAEVSSLTFVTDLFHNIKPISLVFVEYIP